MNRILSYAVAALAVLGLAASASPALAGGTGGGGGYPCGECPTVVVPVQTFDKPIVAPKGQYKSYRHELRLVNATCAAYSSPQGYFGQLKTYRHYKRRLDLRLDKLGLDPSPKFTELWVSGLQAPNMKVVHSECYSVQGV